MIKLHSIKIVLLLILILIFQLFIPIMNIGGIIIVPDILIVFLTYIGFYYGRLEAILIGFFLGFIQDFATQLDLLGSMSLIKSIIGYSLGSLALYRSIWNIKFRLAIIFLIYILHFILFYFISLNGLMIGGIIFCQIVFCQSVLCFCILLFFDRYIMTNGILK